MKPNEKLSLRMCPALIDGCAESASRAGADRSYRGATGEGYFLAPSTCSLKLFATEKRTFLRAGILTGSPV